MCLSVPLDTLHPLRNPNRKLLTNLLAASIAHIQQDHAGIVLNVSYSPPNALIDRLHAEILIVLIPGRRLKRPIQVPHPLHQLRTGSIGVGQTHDHNAPSQFVGEVQPLAKLATDNAQHQGTGLRSGPLPSGLRVVGQDFIHLGTATWLPEYPFAFLQLGQAIGLLKMAVELIQVVVRAEEDHHSVGNHLAEVGQDRRQFVQLGIRAENVRIL